MRVSRVAWSVVWFGDLDLTVEEDNLQQLADRIGEIAVTPEQPYRSDGLPHRFEDDPKIKVFRPRR